MLSRRFGVSQGMLALAQTETQNHKHTLLSIYTVKALSYKAVFPHIENDCCIYIFLLNTSLTCSCQYSCDNIGLFNRKNVSRNAESITDNNEQKWLFAEQLTPAISQANTRFINFSRLTRLTLTRTVIYIHINI